MATIERYELRPKIGRDGLPKKPPIRYRVRYRKPDGNQTDKRGFLTKAAAEAFAATVEVEKLTGAYIAPTLGRVALSDFGEPWMKRQLHVKESWSTRVESIWRIHIEPWWGDRQVGSITRTEVQDWVIGLNRAASTVSDILSVFAMILDDAVEQRFIAANPARGVKLPRRGHVEHNYLSHGQVAQLALASKHPDIVMLLAYTGLRWGEMAALRPRDVSVDVCRIRVARSASKVNSRSVLTTPKNWERRTVAAPEEVIAMIEPRLDRAPDTLLWSRPDGEPLRPPTTTHWFGAAVARCIEVSIPRGDDGEPTGPPTFPRVTVHELRHTAASLMIASGAHVKTVQRQLGHKTATMTLDLYGHLFPDDLDDVASRMSTGLRAAKCGQNVGTQRPELRVVNEKSSLPAVNR